MSVLIDSFVEEARGVSIAEAVSRLGLMDRLRSASGEFVGACPVCGSSGKSKNPDGFAVAPAKSAWNCRQGGIGGRDAIGLVGHVEGLQLDRRDEFLLACAAVLGRAVPEGAEESDADKAARGARLAETQKQKAARDTKAAAEQDAYREKEREKARGKWRSGFGGGPGLAYLCARLDAEDLPLLPFMHSVAAEPYWHGQDERGNAVEIHEGPAMIFPFVDPAGLVIGCHITWVDMRCAPKFRPRLRDGDDALPTKKMRGSKKGGLIPLYGFEMVGERILPEAGRWRLAIGEGIENTLAVAVVERFRSDTLYAAAGDLGNLAGPADQSSSFGHPVLKQETKRGPRAVRVAGPVPKPDQAVDDSFQAPEQVSEILFVADGDSETYATMAAMMRAETRCATAGCTVATAWPPQGFDFTDLLVGACGVEAA